MGPGSHLLAWMGGEEPLTGPAILLGLGLKEALRVKGVANGLRRR